MKRYVLAMVLAFIPCAHVLGGTVTLVSKEGQEFALDESTARLSGLMESVIDVVDDGTNLPLSQLSSDYLQTITEDLKSLYAWYEQQHQHPLPLYEHDENIASRIQRAKQYVAETPPTAIDVQKALALLKATDYLNVPELKHRYARDIAEQSVLNPVKTLENLSNSNVSEVTAKSVAHYLKFGMGNVLFSLPLATSISGTVHSAVLFPDNTNVLISSWQDKKARVMNAQTGAEVHTIAHNNVHSTALSPDGSKILINLDHPGQNSSIISDAKTFQEIGTINYFYSPNTMFFPDNTKVLLVSHNSLQVYDTLTSKSLHMNQYGTNRAVIISPDSAMILLITDSGVSAAHIINIATGQALAVPHRAATRGHSSGASIVTTSDRISIIPDNDKTIVIAAFSYDNAKVLTLPAKNTILISNAQTGGRICDIRHNTAITLAIFSHDSSKVLDVAGNRITISDATSGERVCTIKHDKEVKKAVFSRDDMKVLSSDDNITHMNNAQTGKPIATVQHNDAIFLTLFSPDDTKALVVAGNTATIINALTGQTIRTIQLNNKIMTAQFSPDSTQILTLAQNDAARIIDAQTGEQIGRVPNDTAVWSAHYSRDGSRIITIARDTAHISRFPLAEITGLEQLLAVLIAVNLHHIGNADLTKKIDDILAKLTPEQKEALRMPAAPEQHRDKRARLSTDN